MLTIKDNDSFGVELCKIFVQSIAGAAVATAGIATFVVGAGAALEFKKNRAARKNPPVPAPETETA